MPCVQEKERQQRYAYVRANRRDVDPYQGIDDPVEILKIVHQPPKPDPLIRYARSARPTAALYGELDSGHVAALMRHAHALLKNGNTDPAHDIARCLVAFTSADVSSLLREFIRLDELRPEFVFHKATPETRELLVRRLARVAGRDELLTDKLLCALAWIGDDRVVELFAEWRIKPPRWASDLYVPAERYSQQAGWELSTDLQRRNLYHEICYPLIQSTSSATPSPVMALTDRVDHCPSCTRPLTNLFEFDGTSDALAFLSCREQKILVATCESCLNDLSGRVNETSAVWSGQYEAVAPVPSVEDVRLPRRSLVPAEAPRSPWHAADDSLPTQYSQIGGHPTWIQDATYPSCSECRRTMVFVGQIACEDVDANREGMFYAFLCAGCRMTATSHQQS